jgi:hypothetical protein
MRWVLFGAGAVALCYIVFLFAVLVTVGEEHLPPGQINTVVLVVFGIAIGAATNVLLIDRVIAARTAQIDKRITIVEADLRSQIKAAIVHFDLRADAATNNLIERGLQLEEATGDLSGAAWQPHRDPPPRQHRRTRGSTNRSPVTEEEWTPEMNAELRGLIRGAESDGDDELGR